MKLLLAVFLACCLLDTFLVFTLSFDDDVVLPKRSRVSRRRGNRLRLPISVDNSDDNSCSGTTDKGEIYESFKALFLIGDRDLVISHDEDDQKEHCKKGEKHLKNFNDHVKCIDGKHKEFIKIIADGFKKAVDRRCIDKSWHDQYLEFSDCFANKEVQEELHSCSDKAYAAMSYSLRKLAKKDQLVSTCCIAPIFNDCTHNKTTKICSRKAANFITLTFWEPFSGAVKYLCKDESLDWCDNHPEMTKAYKAIFSRRARKHKEGLYQIFLNLIENHFNNN